MYFMFCFTRIALKLKVPIRQLSRNIYRNKLLILFCNQRDASDADFMFEKNFLISDHPPGYRKLSRFSILTGAEYLRDVERVRERAHFERVHEHKAGKTAIAAAATAADKPKQTYAHCLTFCVLSSHTRIRTLARTPIDRLRIRTRTGLRLCACACVSVVEGSMVCVCVRVRIRVRVIVIFISTLDVVRRSTF